MQIDKFIKDQLSVWPMAAANFRAVKTALSRQLKVFGIEATVQHNPCRIISSTAEVDEKSIASRACFLCPENRPAEQFHLKFQGRKNRRYNIQINPYPIFPKHLVVARDEHIPQAIWHHLPDILDFCCKYKNYLAFYNGPESGASAPDHLHFQACERGILPLETAVDAFLDNPSRPLATNKDASLYLFEGYTNGIFALKATTSKSLTKLFYRLLCCCEATECSTEPKFNLFTWHTGSEFRAFVVMRSQLRSHHYYAEGNEHLTMSPGAADVAGYFIAPMKEDYDKLTSAMLEDMMRQVTISKKKQDEICGRLTRPQRIIEVGLASGKEIVFEIISDGAGPQRVMWKDGRINYNGTLYDELYFDAVTRSTLFAEPTFILHDVTIGIDFHWERKRTLRYAGSLKFVVEGDNVTAVCRIGIEDYLLSVISSEMKSTAGLELLKAHAIISRSWAYRRMDERKDGKDCPHALYDVCADDHCQRYQGVGMAEGDNVRKAIDATWGKTLQYNGEICDTRYSKCCGGRTERFSACWEDVDYPYLTSVEDKWCDCTDNSILSQVLNDYDLETADFHDWEEKFTGDELSALLNEKCGLQLGTVKALIPLERGDSGRIIRLRIEGSEGNAEIGKELAIRKALSRTHLKSSAFEVRKDGDLFVLTGHGWGHGVGLCQIGAAAMAAAGKSYEEILKHYYKDAKIV